MNKKHIERVRRICAALPETIERLSHGEPTFFVRKKVFAMFSNNHHNDGHVAVLVPAPPGIQSMLIEGSPEKFYKPPYVGGAGWIGIELPRVDDEELAFHISEAWRLIAPKRLQATVEGSSAERRSGHEKKQPQVTAFANSEVAKIFKSYPTKARSRLMFLRQLIFDTAAKTEGVGEVEESLKWGEPSYVTKAPRSGTPIRIDCRKADSNKYAMYFHCQTNLIKTFRTVFPNEFTYEGNRAIIFDEDDEVPVKELAVCISAALTYHSRKSSMS
jgi:hypothetical protein